MGEGQKRLAEAFKRARSQRHLTQEQLAERAGVSDRTVRDIESGSAPFPTRRRAGGLAIENLADELGTSLPELLRAAGLTASDVAGTSLASYLDDQEEPVLPVRDLLAAPLADFVQMLPEAPDDLLQLPVLALTDAKAFAYIFALERAYPALEMLIVNEPPILLLDEEDVGTWIDGMGLQGADRGTFRALVATYRDHWLRQVEDRQKRYQVVLRTQGYASFLARKPTLALVRQHVERLASLVDAPTGFELVFLDSDVELDEYEVISATREIPPTYEDTLSVVIRQTSMSATKVEYSITPMPHSYTALQRDIARIHGSWASALDSYGEGDVEEVAGTPQVIEPHRDVTLAKLDRFRDRYRGASPPRTTT
jgi:transcriptional regulator with XRE-family HTH domain